MSLSSLPSVDRLLQSCGDLLLRYGRPLTLRALRFVLDEIRAEIIAGSDVPTNEIILDRVERSLLSWISPTLFPVINATGVVLHTNMGRSPLSRQSVAAMSIISSGYSNLEFDLSTGKRGSRLIHTEAILQKLTGAEAGLVVNNCASAVMLVLAALAYGKHVVISRSQLVEIGGGFRVPDVMRQSGARLVEIGTTNKVRISDYEEALGAIPGVGRGVVMRAHRSNFKIIGFTEEPGLKEIIEKTHQYGAIFMDDLGSGALVDTSRYGMEHEPTVQESVLAGADVVMFSGDKLLGGPQAGIIVGKSAFIQKIKKHPMARAVRADKSCLAGLSATLTHYLKDEFEREIPIWRMISMPLTEAKQIADSWRDQVGWGEVVEAQSTVGGGSLPGETLSTMVLSLPVKSPERAMKILRGCNPPVIARTQNNRVMFDPRTVLPDQYGDLLKSLRYLLSKEGKI